MARRLVARGYHVKGSTTSPEKLAQLEAAGITPYLLRFDPWLQGEQVSDFFKADVLFFNIPPGRRRPDVESFFDTVIRDLVKELRYSPIDWLLFASSTSVYAEVNGPVYEENAGKHQPWSLSGRALLAAEQTLREADAFETTILRFAGLYGYDRQPGRFLAGRTDVARGAAPVNLVHQDDAVAVVEAVIEQDVRGEAFNVCADAHPTRRALYVAAARQMGLAPPTFADDKTTSFKIVTNQKLKERLGYTFQHPDPLASLG